VGYKHSEETKRKISLGQIGRVYRRGFRLSPEHREKLGRGASRAMKGQCGPLSRTWRGGKHADDRGYINVTLENGKRRREHSLVAEEALGRSFKKSEVVHHINGNKADNRNCNLLICDRQYHQWLHSRMAELYMREHFSEGAQ
jgi:hypothetical protein